MIYYHHPLENRVFQLNVPTALNDDREGVDTRALPQFSCHGYVVVQLDDPLSVPVWQLFAMQIISFL